MQNLSDNSPEAGAGWWSRLETYQKLVFIVAAAAWMFDCLDQQLFNLARKPAMAALVSNPDDRGFYGGIATMVFMLGWGTGGMIFGSLGDRYGRVKMLAITIALYSIATGLSALSVHITDFCIYRFITGLGVGGVFGLSVAVVADTLPTQGRTRALGVLQSFSTVGNVGAGLIGLAMAGSNLGWKSLFLIGAVPALLTASIQFKMKEPQQWLESRDRTLAAGRKAGSYKELFGSPRWRRHSVFGVLLCCAGVVGLWGIGVFSSDMVNDIVTRNMTVLGKSAVEIGQAVPVWASMNLLSFNVGGYAGMLAFTYATERVGRRKAFAFFFTGALLATVFAYQKMNGATVLPFLKGDGQIMAALRSDIPWLAAIMGFFQLSVFAGFSIYLPELFPDRLRSTGTSFCYNVGRYLAATAPFTLAQMATSLGKSAQEKAVAALPTDAITSVIAIAKTTAKIDAFRNSASMMSLVFLLGIVVLPFLPETKGQRLPED
ncbi:MAG: nanT 1 [Akkermansiaceae bacterium]|nr:nanT 1 [Akkermansiaceae bacterium]